MQNKKKYAGSSGRDPNETQASRAMQQYRSYGYKSDGTRRMGLGCTLTFFKKTVIFVNIVFTLLGLALIGLGIFALVSDIRDLMGLALPIGLFIIGGLVVLIAAFGVCGAIWHNRIMLKIYCATLFLLVLAQIIAGIVVFVERARADEIVTKSWNQSSLSARAKLQDTFDCCGFKQYNVSAALPCPTKATAGCYSTLKDKFENNFNIIAIISVVFASFELVGLVFGCGLLFGLPSDEAKALLSDSSRLSHRI